MTGRNVRVFLLSFGLVFAMVFLQRFAPKIQLLHKNACIEIAGFQLNDCQNQLVSPITKHTQTMQSLQSQLKQKIDSYPYSCL